MTAKDLFEAIGLVEDGLILEADAPAARPRPWLAVARRTVPLAACLCLAAGAALALRGGVMAGILPGGGARSTAEDSAAQRAGAAAQEPAAPGGGSSSGAEGGIETYGADAGDAPAPKKVYAAEADGARIADVPEEDALCALPRVSGNVMYWGSQLEPELQLALWGEGEPEPWQNALAALPAEVQPDAAPDTLPVLVSGEPVDEYDLLSQSDAQALLLDGAFLSEESVPRGAADPANALDAELVYNPAGAALRVPMWAFTVPTGTDCGDVVCYVPAVDLDLLRQLLPDA